MTLRTLMTVVCALALSAASACSPDDTVLPQDSEPRSDAVGDVVVPEEAPAIAVDEGLEEETEPQESVGMISSGTVEAPPQQAAPERPTQAGVSRVMQVNEIRPVVEFNVLEPDPGMLPDETYLGLVHLVTPHGDGPEPGLPFVRMIYTIDSVGTFRIQQSAADGRPMPAGDESEAVTIGGDEGLVVRSAGSTTIVRETGGTRIEIISSDVAEDILLQIAASLGSGN